MVFPERSIVYTTKKMILSAAPKTHLPINTTTTTLTQQPPTKSLSPFFSSYKRNNASSSSLTNQTSQDPNPSPNSNTQIQHQVNHGCKEDDDDENLVVSASAIAAVIRKASTISSVEFVQKIEKDGSIDRPSSDFLQLCSEQLDLFRKIVDRDTLLSVYVRPAGSYVMDRLELHRVTFHPSSNVAETAEIVALIGTFHIPTGLRVAEIALSNLQAEVIHECKAVVFPMVKHPFVVGFLVAEFPKMDFDTSKNIGNGQDLQLCTPQESYALPLHSERRRWDLKAFQEGQLEAFGRFTAEQKSSVINISRTLAMAYVMDQKAILLQQSSWQNNIRMSDLVEQIRGSLSSIRSLSKMLSIHTKKSEISYDIIEDILVQGEQMRDTLQQLQDAVYLTKANIVQYNDDPVKRLKRSATYVQPNEPGSPHLLDNLPSGIHSDKTKQLSAIGRDLELPMPPLALVPLRQHEIRPSNVFDVLEELVGAAEPLAHKLERKVELSQISNSSSSSSLVAVEESALRQALSNLIEGGLLRTHVNGKVEIVSTGAPAGGVLVVIDDDGPDMHYMTQMHSLTPFGPDLFTDGVIEDNMTWNFISGLTVAREILESYGCVLRVISPRAQDAVFGAGGTRIEIWLPCHTTNSDKSTNEENLS